MATVNGIAGLGGVRPGAAMPQVGSGAIGRQEGGQTRPGDFARMLRTYVENVDNRQQASYEAIRDMVSGRTENVLPVVNAVAKADLSFKLLMGVRNKVVEAYKQTMNMQV